MKKGTKVIGLGASLASLAATAYFFLGPDAKKNQKYAKSWAIKMKGDVVAKLEAARNITKPVYHEIIDNVAAKHEKVVATSSKEVKELAGELKKHWNTINTVVKEEAKPDDLKKIVKKAVKKQTITKPVAKKK